MTYNLPEMQELLRWAEAGGDNGVALDMKYWVREAPSCGTTMCMGGYVVARRGAEFIEWTNRPLFQEVEGSLYLDCVLDGRTRTISDTAQEILGLNDAEAALLFAQTDELKAEDLAARSIAFLRDLIDLGEQDEGMTEVEVDEWNLAWQAENLT